MCSDEFFFLSSVDGTNPNNSANHQFCGDLISWNFQKTGVLKCTNIKHQRKTDGKSLEKYKIKDELEYMIDILEFEPKTNTWKPYLTDDLQIEYTMLNPAYRLQLKHLANNKPTYYVTFKVRILIQA